MASLLNSEWTMSGSLSFAANLQSHLSARIGRSGRVSDLAPTRSSSQSWLLPLFHKGSNSWPWPQKLNFPSAVPASWPHTLTMGTGGKGHFGQPRENAVCSAPPPVLSSTVLLRLCLSFPICRGMHRNNTAPPWGCQKEGWSQGSLGCVLWTAGAVRPALGAVLHLGDFRKPP